MHILIVEFTLLNTIFFHDFKTPLNDATPTNAPTPDMCGAAKLVPIPYDTSRPVSNEFTPSVIMPLVWSPPGADTAIKEPQLLYAASFPSLVLAATAITPLQLAGK